MKLGYFIGGALLGAAGLTAAALFDAKCNPRPALPEPDKARSMDADSVADGLSEYCRRATTLNLEQCIKLMPDGSMPPIYLDDADILDRVRTRVAEGLCFLDRKFKMSALRGFHKDAVKLYRQHRCLFVRANAILKGHGKEGVDLKALEAGAAGFAARFAALQAAPVLNDYDEDEAEQRWWSQYSALLLKVQDFVAATVDAANLLADRLEELSAPAKTEAPAVEDADTDAPLPEGTAPAV